MIHWDVSEGVCTLLLDVPPANTMTPALVVELCDAIDRARQDPAVQGVVLTGGPERFSSGLDIALFGQLHSAEDAIGLCKTFQDAFQRIEDCGKPVVAALAGNVLGGALELAMACHVRVASRSARFRMPEVTLGINPGAGGTQRLPRLAGPSVALRALLTAEWIGAEDALECGLVDQLCDTGSLIQQARLAAGSVGVPQRTCDRCDKIPKGERLQAAIADGRRLADKARPELVAPRTIVEAVRAGLEESLEVGLQRERDGFAACIESQATQNKIHLFHATRQAPKVAALAAVTPLPVVNVAVIGLGTMGSGIAQALLSAGLKVVAYDQEPAALDRGRTKIVQSLARQVEQGRLAQDRADHLVANLSVTDQWSDLAQSDLVVEAVFEDVALKQSVFRQLEATCRAETIFASNTSTISLDVLAEPLVHPERLVGMHFFNPAQRMPLVEIIQPALACPEAVASAMSLVRTLRKTAVLVKSKAGFLVSRMFVPYLKEAFWLVEEGAEPEVVDRAMVEFGFPMGPLALIDMAGLDILALTSGVLQREFPRHGDLPLLVAGLVDRGHLGQKTGAGVYRYEPGVHEPRRHDLTDELLAEIRRRRGLVVRAIGTEEITRRLVLRMVNEAFTILDDGIAQRPSDLDVAVVLGLGFPDFRGGVVRYAEDCGLDCVAAELVELAESCGVRFAPSPRLCKC